MCLARTYMGHGPKTASWVGSVRMSARQNGNADIINCSEFSQKFFIYYLPRFKLPELNEHGLLHDNLRFFSEYL